MTVDYLLDAKKYWLNQLNTVDGITHFPYSNASNIFKEANKATIKCSLDPDTAKKINTISGQSPNKNFIIFLAAINILLQKYSQTEDIKIGVPIYKEPSGKDLINDILTIRNEITDAVSFKDVIVKTSALLQEADRYKNYPFEKIVYQHQGGNEEQKKAFFDVIALSNALHDKNYITNYNANIVFNLIDQNGTLDYSIDYNTNVYSERYIKAISENLNYLLAKLLENLNSPIKNTTAISKAEEHRVLETFNTTAITYSKDKTIIDVFEEQVKKTPNHTAVVYKSQSLSYQELNALANAFAAYLNKEKTINTGDYVGIKLARSEKLLVAILGVLKVGCTYVPIDTNYPEERIAYIEKDSACTCIINEDTYTQFTLNRNHYKEDRIKKQNSPEATAYIIYTSGTSGNPKGVMISHANAVAMLQWSQTEFNSQLFDTVYATTSQCFDLSIFELFFPLSIGKTVRLLENALEIGAALPNDKKVLINTVPSSIRTIIESGISLENATVINLAGESFPPDILEHLFQTNPEIRNLYGPSEDTTYSTCYKLESGKKYTTVPIGKPISNTFAYILNNNLKPLPIGVPGKLYLSGTGITKGYLNNPELTAERFISNPFKDGERMYDTGDIAKWLPDGTIEYLGRKDNQVKIRGYRIELEEIEHTLVQFSEAIQQAVLYVREKELIAYYVSKSDIDKSKLKAFLQDKLPSYMVPSYYVALEAIPLTSNGKTDKKALAEITPEALIQKEYVAPKNDTERKLVEIWQDVLGIETVGIRDNFFELGGHSLMIGQVINQVYKQLNGTITFKTFFHNPTIENITKTITKETYVAIPKALKKDYYPLTPSQHRIWVLSQLEGGNVAYNMSGTVIFKGTLDTNKFKKAFSLLFDKHDILRTAFKANQEGDIHQYIVDNKTLTFDIEYLDFKEQTTNEIDAYIYKQQAKPFDLTKAPLIKASLLQIEEKEHLFSFVMHHIIGDGWSMELLVSELVTMYNKLLKNEEPKTETLAIQYKDYSVWLQSQLEKESYKTSEAFWLNQFRGDIPVLNLPSLKKRPVIQTYNGKTVNHEFSKAFLSQLKTFTKTQEATLFITLMAGIKAMLYRYTNQEDIIVGTPIAGREHPDLENQIGLYLNTLAVRTQLKEDFCFQDLVQQLKETLLEAYEHQSYSFDELVSKLDLKRDTSRSPLFDVMVVLQNQKQVQSITSNNLSLEGIEVKPYKIERNASQLDISFTFIDEDEKLQLEIEYNTDIYDAFLITRMFNHFENLLNQVINNPKAKLQSINYLTKEESKQILEAFNTTKVAYPKEQTILNLIEEQVVKTPEAIAVVVEDRKLTYTALNEKSNQLANYLRKHYNIQPDDLVAIKLDRSENLLVAILGVLKSGGAYVPIDSNYPKDRIAYIEKDSKSKVVINQSFFKDFEKDIATYSKANLKHNILPSNLAYVMYTSGTTGNPKGVMVKHSNVINQILWYTNNFQINSNSNIVLLTAYTFDPSTQDIFGTLIKGGKLHVLAQDKINDLVFLHKFIKDNQISILNYVPNFIDDVLSKKEKIESLKTIIVGGEPLLPQVKDRLLNKGYIVYNNYGPTETTVDVLSGVMTKGSVHIGKPIANTKAFILDKQNNILPIGVSGKLMISGDGVSKGYLNQTQLTQEKFIVNPFEAGEIMYSTGDIARWLPDGTIEFLGRNDHQVKIRGYRIELGEIENALDEFSEDIKQIVVSVKEINNEKTLVAYYVSSTKIEKTKLKQFLLEKLPDYMVPSFFIPLETLPLTHNGKIDRKQLPDIGEKDIVKNPYTAPKNETERQLVNIWKTLLGVETIGTEDDFFELGGHSLIINKVLAEIQVIFKKQIAFETFFKSPTIAKLGYEIDKIQNGLKQPTLKNGTFLNAYVQDKTNVFFIPGIIGSPIVFNDLAAGLKTAFNCIGFQYKGVAEQTLPEDDISSIVDNFTEELLTIQTEGTINIVGYSIGAFIAYEIAKRLENKGRLVHLILIDKDLKTQFTPQENEWFIKAIEDYKAEDNNPIINNLKPRVIQLFKHNTELLSKYKPEGQLNADIYTIHGVDNNPIVDMMQWDKYTNGEIQNHAVPGDHFNLLNNNTALENIIKKIINNNLN